MQRFGDNPMHKIGLLTSFFLSLTIENDQEAGILTFPNGNGIPFQPTFSICP